MTKGNRGHCSLNTMANQHSFLLRLDPKVLAALKKWAEDDLRSVNAQVEFLLREALIKANRYKKITPQEESNTHPTDHHIPSPQDTPNSEENKE